MKKALAPKPRVVNQPAIHPDEAHLMLATIKSVSGRPIIKIYTELLAHLFTRPSELRLAQWSEFNLQKSEWHIPAERMKMAAPHIEYGVYSLFYMAEQMGLSRKQQNKYVAVITGELYTNLKKRRHAFDKINFLNRFEKNKNTALYFIYDPTCPLIQNTLNHLKK